MPFINSLGELREYSSLPNSISKGCVELETHWAPALGRPFTQMSLNETFLLYLVFTKGWEQLEGLSHHFLFLSYVMTISRNAYYFKKEVPFLEDQLLPEASKLPSTYSSTQNSTSLIPGLEIITMGVSTTSAHIVPVAKIKLELALNRRQ